MIDSRRVFVIIGIIWSFTLLRSILIMLAGKNIFKRASKNEKTALYPVINLFTMLEICDINTFWGILLFIPIVNIFVLFMMSYKLSDEEYFKAMDKIRDKDINLMTDDEIRKQTESLPKEEKEDVDSIFKSNIQLMEQVEPYKAAKIDILGMEKLKNHQSEDDPTLRDLGFAPKKDKKEESTEEKKDDVEVVDL